MADTITIVNDIIQIVPNAAGMSNFDITTYFPNGIRLSGIGWTGSAAADVLKVRNKTGTGAFITNPTLTNTQDAITFEPPLDCFPYILASEQTQGTPANCIISLFFC